SGRHAELVDQASFLIRQYRGGTRDALYAPEAQIGHHEEGLVFDNWTAQIGIEIVRFPIRLARQTSSEGCHWPGCIFLKERRCVQNLISKHLGKIAMQSISTRLGDDLDGGSGIASIFGFGRARYHAEFR